MSKKKIIGLAMVIMSAGIYLAYPISTTKEFISLTIIWAFALFGGAFTIMGAMEELIDKIKRRSPQFEVMVE
jgi:heme O synthase-like polyprenyltransferase